MAPSMEKLLGCVQAMDGWNRSDPGHVCAVHCKGGKGRTGVIVAAYMLQVKNFMGDNATNEAMDHFAVTRFNTDDPIKYGISGKAQRRYVNYFYDIIQGKFGEVWDKQMFLESVVMNNVPDFDKEGGCRPFLKLSEFPIGDTQLKDIFEWPPPDSDPVEFKQADGRIEIPVNMLLKLGDLVARCYHNSGKKKMEPIWRVQFHMCSVTNHEITFAKSDLDDTKAKDTRFAESSTVTFKFCPKRSPVSDPPFHLGAALEQSFAKAKPDLITTAKMEKASSESIRAMQLGSSEAERLDLMQKVKAGELSVNDAVAKSKGLGSEAERLDLMQKVKAGELSVNDAVAKASKGNFDVRRSISVTEEMMAPHSVTSLSQATTTPSDDELNFDIGSTVRVDGYNTTGVVRFIGAHHTKGYVRVGVELEQPVGLNNGTVDDYAYFECDENHGVIVKPHKVHVVTEFDTDFSSIPSIDPFSVGDTATSSSPKTKAKESHRRSASDATLFVNTPIGITPNPFEVPTNETHLSAPRVKGHARSTSDATSKMTSNPFETSTSNTAPTSPNPFGAPTNNNPFGSDSTTTTAVSNPFAMADSGSDVSNNKVNPFGQDSTSLTTTHSTSTPPTTTTTTTTDDVDGADAQEIVDTNDADVLPQIETPSTTPTTTTAADTDPTSSPGDTIAPITDTTANPFATRSTSTATTNQHNPFDAASSTTTTTTPPTTTTSTTTATATTTTTTSSSSSSSASSSKTKTTTTINPFDHTPINTNVVDATDTSDPVSTTSDPTPITNPFESVDEISSNPFASS